MMAQCLLLLNSTTPFMHLLEELLLDEGYEIAHAAASHTNMAPALIILDMEWGQEDEVLTQIQSIKADPLLAAIPMLLCTAAERQMWALKEKLASQHVTVLLKPFDFDALLRAIRLALASAT